MYFIVLNKIDTIDEEEIDTTKLLSPTIANEYSVYQMSALKYLAGILSDNQERIRNSGAEKFKNDLNEYLMNLDKKFRFNQNILFLIELNLL